MRLAVRREPSGVSMPDWCQRFGRLWGSFTVAFSGVCLDVCVFVSSCLWVCCVQVFVLVSVNVSLRAKCMHGCDLYMCKPTNLWVCVWECACVSGTCWRGRHTFLATATVCWLSRDLWISHFFSCSSVVLIVLLWILIGCQKACNTCPSNRNYIDKCTKETQCFISKEKVSFTLSLVTVCTFIKIILK